MDDVREVTSDGIDGSGYESWSHRIAPSCWCDELLIADVFDGLIMSDCTASRGVCASWGLQALLRFFDAVSSNNYLDGRPPGSPLGTFMLMR